MTLQWRGNKETMLRMLNGEAMPEGLVRKRKKKDAPDTCYFNLDGIMVEVVGICGNEVRLKFSLTFKGMPVLDLNQSQTAKTGDSITVHGLKIKSSMVLS